MMLTKLKAFVIGALLLLSKTATAHGYLATPPARNVQRNSMWCPQCLNAGGGWETFTKGHGLCGDPIAETKPRNHEAFGKLATPPVIAATYKRGSTITAKAVFTANHLGRWSLRLCPLKDPSSAGEAKELTQACLDAHTLKRVDNGSPYTYVLGNQNSYETKYRLPPRVTCKRCVLQWTYETGNSCTPANTPPKFVPNPSLGTCGTPNAAAGEGFWNCGDIAITK